MLDVGCIGREGGDEFLRKKLLRNPATVLYGANVRIVLGAILANI